MYPVLGGILGTLWFIWPFIGGAIPEKMFVQILSGILYEKC